MARDGGVGGGAGRPGGGGVLAVLGGGVGRRPEECRLPGVPRGGGVRG